MTVLESDGERVALAGAGMLVVAAFLPVSSAGGLRLVSPSGSGLVPLAAGVAAWLVVLFGSWSAGQRVLVAGAGGLVLGVSLRQYLDVSSSVFAPGAGLYLAVLGGLGLVVAGGLAFVRGESPRS